MIVGIRCAMKEVPGLVRDQQMEEIKRKAEEDAQRVVKEAVERAKMQNR